MELECFDLLELDLLRVLNNHLHLFQYPSNLHKMDMFLFAQVNKVSCE